MTKLSRILKDYREAGSVNSLVGVLEAIDERMFRTKSGDLLVILATPGVDYECLDPAQLQQITHRFESAARIFDQNFRFYQYLLKRDSPPIPNRSYENPVVRAAVESRTAYLQGKNSNLYSLEIYYALVYEWSSQNQRSTDRLSRLLRNPLRGVRETLSTHSQIAILDDEVHRAQEILNNKVTSFVVQLQDTLQVDVLDKQRAFHFFRRLLNYTPYKADTVRLKYDQFVDFQACDSILECHRDHLQLDEHYVEVLTLKVPPARTFAHMLRAVQEVACNYIIASEWKREDGLSMRRLIQSKRRHFHNSKSSMANYVTANAQTTPRDMLIDDSAVALVGNLGACLEELEVNGRHFGQFSVTIVLYDRNRAALKRAVAECFKVFATHDAQIVPETYNLINAWAAVLPGNSAYNLRRLHLLDTNYADLSFLFTLHTGDVENAHLRAEYLAALETNHDTLYFLNLHHQDIGHTVMLGATGSGKSFALNFLLTHLQKYQPLTYIFDLDGSFENVTRLFGGTYLPVGIEKRSFTINPFCLPPTKENLHFLFSFVRVLIESGGYRLSPNDERDLYDQIENMYVIEPDQRRLSTLANMLSRIVRAHLQKWVDGGSYAALFDNAIDNLTFAPFQTFDCVGMDKFPQVLEPLLFYILHRANDAIHDDKRLTTLKVFAIDEAWRFLRHATIKLYVMEALKTWRKRNAAVILATQSSDDLLRSEMLSVVVESCATKVFLANPNVDLNAYREIFHLNETEAEWITRLIPKQQMLIKRPDVSKVVNLNVGSRDYWLYTSSPHDRQRRQEAFERYGFEQGLEILARSHPS